MGCDYSKKYVEPLYTSLFGKLFAWATNQNYENYSAQLDDFTRIEMDEAKREIEHLKREVERLTSKNQQKADK